MNSEDTIKTEYSSRIQILISAFIWAAAVSLVILFGSHSLPGNDVFYHIKMAEFIKNGQFVINDFHWTTCSIWSKPFFNKEWLFHIYLVPFVYLFGAITGAKAAIITTAFLIALAWGNLLKTLKVKNILFAMFFMLFCTGHVYLGRLVLCRSFLISILFMPLALDCMIRNRRALFVLIIYLYMLAYVGAWQILPITCIFDFFRFLASEKKKEYLKKEMMIPWAATGVAAGLILTPYFPVNINAIYTQTILILKAQWFGTAKAGTLPMGTELTPISLKILICYIGLFLLFAVTVYDLFHRQLYRLPTSRRINAPDIGTDKKDSSDYLTPETRAFLLLSTLYLIMTVFTQKFVEYLVPFFTVTTFLYWSRHPLPAWNSTCPFYTPHGECDFTLSRIRKKFVIALLILSGVVSIFLLRDFFYRKYPVYQDSSEWIRKNVPEETLIFSGDWDDNVILFYYLENYKFLVVLDPYFMYAYNPDKFLLWLKIVTGKMIDPAEAIWDNFKTKTVFVPPDRPIFKHRLLMDDKAKMRYEGKNGESIFTLSIPESSNKQ